MAEKFYKNEKFQKVLDAIKRFFKSEKFQKIFPPFFYFLVVSAVAAVAVFVFDRTYYTNIVVSGSSMAPTLMGGSNNDRLSHYGISDNHRRAINNLERFDVLITYYPSSWNGGDEDTTYKIKRVWGFPGETLKMEQNDNTYTFTVTKDEREIYKVSAPITTKNYIQGSSQYTWKVATFATQRRTFDTHVERNNALQRTSFTITLKDTPEKREYFVMGDNWTASSDSFSHLGNESQITYENLQGKIIKIKGVANYNAKDGTLVNKQTIKNMYYF